MRQILLELLLETKHVKVFVVNENITSKMARDQLLPESGVITMEILI